MKKVYKYATGADVPEGAVYLNTKVETDSTQETGDYGRIYTSVRNTFVWHYFLVEVEQND